MKRKLFSDLNSTSTIYARVDAGLELLMDLENHNLKYVLLLKYN